MLINKDRISYSHVQNIIFTYYHGLTFFSIFVTYFLNFFLWK